MNIGNRCGVGSSMQIMQLCSHSNLKSLQSHYEQRLPHFCLCSESRRRAIEIQVRVLVCTDAPELPLPSSA